MHGDTMQSFSSAVASEDNVGLAAVRLSPLRCIHRILIQFWVFSIASLSN